MLSLKLVGLLALICICSADPIPLEEVDLPPGFIVNVFTNATPKARSLAVSGGDSSIAYISNDLLPGGVYGAYDKDGDGVADQTVTLLSGLNQPNGIAWHKGSLFVAEVTRVTRYDNADASVIANKLLPPGKVIFDQFPNITWHGNKYIRVGPDERLYVDLGAPCNDCKLDNAVGNVSFGSINSMRLDGSDLQPFASGIRNTVGFDWDANGTFYFTNNGIDQLGNDQPDDALNVAPKPGLFYGFPYCHVVGVGNPQLRLQGASQYVPDPDFKPDNATNNATHLAFCEERVQPPVQPLGPHVAALGMRFWKGGGFPSSYNGTVFIAEHGSWARDPAIGYRLAAVKLAPNGTAVRHTIFASGWLLRNGTVWGRPVDVAQARDNSLLVSDDKAGVVYRISYNSSFEAAATAAAATPVTAYQGPP
uniref:Putative extracellular protein CSOL_036 n=1 Tax=Pseudococcomyxa simplex TaxID=464287 RepID=A0A7L9QE20_9CHLO|nr:putative extracellular protein CSOL_036 [Pseudococcomyxa simplex]